MVGLRASRRASNHQHRQVLNMNSLFPVLCVNEVSQSQAFYQRLFDMRAAFEIDWYVQLQSPANEAIQLAFVQRDHPSVPQRFQVPAAGVVVTLEVDDAPHYHDRARELGLQIEVPLRDEPWGQRHFMVVDPDGVLVDVVRVLVPQLRALREARRPQ